MIASSSVPPRRYETSVAKIFSAARPERLVTLAPSILAADFGNLADELRRMTRKKVYWTHIDVMDGHFVPNISVGVPVVASVRKISSRLFLDTHLMIEEPLRYLDAFVKAGSDLVTIHAETVPNDVAAAATTIRQTGARVGFSLRPRTPIDVLAPALDKIDLVLIMTVEPGFGGQSIIPATLSKVRELARERERRGLKFMIQVDGGIAASTAELAVAAGANVLVAGTAVFGPGGVGNNIDRLIRAALGETGGGVVAK